MQSNNPSEILSAYDSAFSNLFKYPSWPSVESLAPAVDNGDTILRNVTPIFMLTSPISRSSIFGSLQRALLSPPLFQKRACAYGYSSTAFRIMAKL